MQGQLCTREPGRWPGQSNGSRDRDHHPGCSLRQRRRTKALISEVHTIKWSETYLGISTDGNASMLRGKGIHVVPDISTTDGDGASVPAGLTRPVGRNVFFLVLEFRSHISHPNRQTPVPLRPSSAVSLYPTSGLKISYRCLTS